MYNIEVYEVELLRNAIPNWMLANLMAEDVLMILIIIGCVSRLLWLVYRDFHGQFENKWSSTFLIVMTWRIFGDDHMGISVQERRCMGVGFDLWLCVATVCY